ncbi:hypothetical protein C8J32_11816 [Rhizobium sp. PP-CC-3A-592]|nr:hypothetical protein C8J32_11816 [Rhizobium sp. PP-CC-3A-592]
MMGFRSSATGLLIPLEFQMDGKIIYHHLPTIMTVNAARVLLPWPGKYWVLSRSCDTCTAGVRCAGAVAVLGVHPRTPKPNNLFKALGVEGELEPNLFGIHHG